MFLIDNNNNDISQLLHNYEIITILGDRMSCMYINVYLCGPQSGPRVNKQFLPTLIKIKCHVDSRSGRSCGNLCCY